VSHGSGPAPIVPGAVPVEEFYEQDERRRKSHVLSYGSGWQQPGVTDANHVLELIWYAATRELVAYYITYDWNRLAPGKMSRDSTRAAAGETVLDSGAGIGRMLGDEDLATSEADVLVLAVLDSAMECHEALWGWRWWQHHPDGFTHVLQRLKAES
jgi:hypothetical protein